MSTTRGPVNLRKLETSNLYTDTSWLGMSHLGLLYDKIPQSGRDGAPGQICKFGILYPFNKFRETVHLTTEHIKHRDAALDQPNRQLS